MKLLVTGATGFLGWRTAALLAERGHEVVTVGRPGGAVRAGRTSRHRVDAGDPAARHLIGGCEAVLHFAGVPDPARARADPARAVRENAGTTLNLLEGCAEHGAALVYPSSARAGQRPAPDAYAASKRLGEEACLGHRARSAVVRLTSVFGPGQVAREGATGAIAAFAARALAREPIVIPGDPERTRDFLYVDDLVDGLERLLAEGPWGEVLQAGAGRATALLEAARLVREAAGGGPPIECPGGVLPPGEDSSYTLDPAAPRLRLSPRPLHAAVDAYVSWLRLHPVAEGRP